jgi:transposase-like protein
MRRRSRDSGFTPEVITVAVRWYLRYGLPYRDVEELLVERGVELDHVTVYRWVQRFTPLLADAAHVHRHATGDRWFVNELVPAAAHITEQYSNNRIEADHGRLKARLRPMRGPKRSRSAAVIVVDHTFVQLPPPWPLRTRRRRPCTPLRRGRPLTELAAVV